MQGPPDNFEGSAWHTILSSRESSVLLVENRDTGGHNSESAGPNPAPRRQILGFAKQGALE